VDDVLTVIDDECFEKIQSPVENMVIVFSRVLKSNGDKYEKTYSD